VLAGRNEELVGGLDGSRDVAIVVVVGGGFGLFAGAVDFAFVSEGVGARGVVELGVGAAV
jgi:hypothetical protein